MEKKGKVIKVLCCDCSKSFEYLYNGHARRICDSCKKEHRREYRSRPEIREKEKEYRNRPEVRKRRLKYARVYQNGGKYHKEYYNRPGIKDHKRKYRKEHNEKPENKLKRAEYVQKYFSKSEARLKRRLKQKRFRLSHKNNPRFKLNENIRNRVRQRLRHGKENQHWGKLVGYELKELQTHLEKQFRPGMTWGNYGKKWQIDHIIPISVFNFTKPEHIDFKRCWSLKNLRPLWSKENNLKSNKLNKPFQPSFLFEGGFCENFS